MGNEGTFTKKLLKEIDNGYTKLTIELEALEQAVITTYDSFSLSLVKKYHYLLNINPHINIIDPLIIITEKKKILDQIFDRYYQDSNPSFLSFN